MHVNCSNSANLDISVVGGLNPLRTKNTRAYSYMGAFS